MDDRPSAVRGSRFCRGAFHLPSLCLQPAGQEHQRHRAGGEEPGRAAIPEQVHQGALPGEILPDNLYRGAGGGDICPGVSLQGFHEEPGDGSPDGGGRRLCRKACPRPHGLCPHRRHGPLYPAGGRADNREKPPDTRPSGQHRPSSDRGCQIRPGGGEP